MMQKKKKNDAEKVEPYTSKVQNNSGRGIREDKNLQLSTGPQQSNKSTGWSWSLVLLWIMLLFLLRLQPRFLSLTKADLYCPRPGLDLNRTQPPASIEPSLHILSGASISHQAFTPLLLLTPASQWWPTCCLISAPAHSDSTY